MTSEPENPNQYICPDCGRECVNYTSLFKHRINYCTETDYKQKNQLESHARLISCDLTKITFKDKPGKEKIPKPSETILDAVIDDIEGEPKSTSPNSKLTKPPSKKTNPISKSTPPTQAKIDEEREAFEAKQKAKKKAELSRKQREARQRALEAKRDEAIEKYKQQLKEEKENAYQLSDEGLGYFQKLKLEVWAYIKEVFSDFSFRFSRLKSELGIDSQDRSKTAFLLRALRELEDSGFVEEISQRKWRVKRGAKA